MINTSTKISFNASKIIKKMAEQTAKNLGHAGNIVRKEAQQLIKPASEPSKPGQPPRSVSGKLRSSIRYDVVDDFMVTIFPWRYYGNILEGGAKHIEPRPFMEPALNRSMPRIPIIWKGTLNK